MNTKTRSALRWPLGVAYVGLAILLAACGSVTPAPTEAAPLRWEDGAVEVRDEKNAWVPVGGETTFELAGNLQSTDPWMVAHNTFASRDFTQITKGLKIEEPVRIKGLIMEDATWLAKTIEPAGERVDPAITLTGTVSSIDPWVVGGLTLPVTDDTQVTGKIAHDMIARVRIILLEDGTWDVLAIAQLSSFMEIPGCATVMATVAAVNGDKVQFAGWPAIPLNEDIKVENEAGKQVVLSPDHMVLVVVCPPQNGRFTITKIIVLRKSAGASAAE